jgi:hypothetical protein
MSARPHSEDQYAPRHAGMGIDKGFRTVESFCLAFGDDIETKAEVVRLLTTMVRRCRLTLV